MHTARCILRECDSDSMTREIYPKSSCRQVFRVVHELLKVRFLEIP